MVLQIVRVSNGYIITTVSGIPISVAPDEASPHELGTAIKFAFNQLEKVISNEHTTRELSASHAEGSSGAISGGAGG